MPDTIPLVDLRLQHEQIADDVARGWAGVVESTSFVLGGDVAAFEQEFAAFSGVEHCVGVGNGTDALEMALRVVGVGPGDEVIVPANSFVASAMAVSRAGATPVFVDVEPDTLLIAADQVEAAIGPRTKAVMPVHLYGQMAPLAPLLKLAADAGIPLVEDAAQSQGARQDGTPAGGAGLIAGTSFYPGKNLGAYGDGGAILTRSEHLAAELRAMRNYGSETKYHHPTLGFNSRLDTLQAVVLRAKLRRLAAWNSQRREAATRYDGLLQGLAVTPPATHDGNEHVWHLYVVQVDDRDRVLQGLTEAGIGAGIHYPVPIHLQGAYAGLGHRAGDFPVAEAAAKRILSLPMFPGISPEQQARVVEALGRAIG
jgi:dTDP-4-amino-4,6-dideoxygalactose transaminase